MKKVYIIWNLVHGDGFQRQFGIFSTLAKAEEFFKLKKLDQENQCDHCDYRIEEFVLDEVLEEYKNAHKV